MIKKKILVLGIGIIMSISSTSLAAYAVSVVSDGANKAHWTKELAYFAEQINKLEVQIENQMNLINKKALDLMSFGEGELASAGRDLVSTFASINSIHDSVNALATDYQKTVNQWHDLMPDARDWKDKSLLNMAEQTAKTRDAWEKALEQGLLVTASHGENERTQTQKALDDALRLSKNAKGSVQAMQSLAQLNALNAAMLQRLESNLDEANRMRAISDIYKINEEKKREAYVQNESQQYALEINALKNSQSKYKPYSGTKLTRK